MRIALLLAASLLAAEPEIHFTAVPQTLIEARLAAYKRKNPEREPAIRALFEQAGCSGEKITEQPVRGLKAPNLICISRGETDSQIVVGAHFDLVDVGNGVVDNWTGAALLPSFYESLTKIPRKHTFVFVAFSGEEKGMIGSKAYVKQLGPEVARVKAMVNLDTLGLAESEVWVSHADKDLVNWIGIAAGMMKLPLGAMNVDGVGSTDSESFREKKIPAITIHSLTSATLRILHSPADRIEAVRVDEYYRTYQLVAGYLSLLDQVLD